jgi:hypothetical protein
VHGFVRPGSRNSHPQGHVVSVAAVHGENPGLRRLTPGAARRGHRRVVVWGAGRHNTDQLDDDRAEEAFPSQLSSLFCCQAPAPAAPWPRGGLSTSAA